METQNAKNAFDCVFVFVSDEVDIFSLI